jgi:predicted XRE-type DNA-binding protein
MTQDIEITTSSGNVFADLGLPDSEELFVKAQLAQKINAYITANKMTQESAAKLLGVDQPKISALMRGKLTGFSLERLFKFLNTIGSDVKITIQPNSSNNARTTVCF